MKKVTLFHDGCNICQGISATMSQTFADMQACFESVDLSVQEGRTDEARSLGVVRLPSLVIDGKVLRLEDHSSIDAH
ncbi:hypothetical protein [Herbaspirillum robiniae]|uniref:Thioredoxin family protein n=1 Tax=Herbaspirillum robiniae TaxID=2014887 RepID=A0ABX2LY00_9BURK|nr:hypothetical protein [Herbaspirillum robiniae]NUU02970.1 hypothetical protein [Herbaspirillum robiniae]